jgi:hypothetical protein
VRFSAFRREEGAASPQVLVLARNPQLIGIKWMTDENGGLPWPSVKPRDSGFDSVRLARAVDFAQAHESRWPHSMYVENGRLRRLGLGGL